jgi:D-galactarolactone cycloisomerase
VQPDLVKCAGLTEAVRIAHLAQAHGKILVPHQTQQTIGHTINVHYLAAFDHSSRAQEYSWVPERAAKLWTLFKQDLSPKGGYATVPDGPGLGLELDEAAMKAQLAAS